MTNEIQTDVAIIGAGSAGLYALREVRRAGRDFLLIDRGPLGTTCARVGCMPSKVALHAGAEWATRKAMAGIGASGVEALSIDLAATWAGLREQRDFFASSGASKARAAAGDKLIEGTAHFLEPTLIEVSSPAGLQRVRARAVVIATGSRPVMPGWLDDVRDRVISTDALFELDALPRSIGILGLGAIGLEMGLALSRLGIRVVGADLAPNVGGIVDPALGQRARERFGQEIELWLGTQTRLERSTSGIVMHADGRKAEVELLLAALGRRPNVDSLGLEAAGFPLDERGTPRFDPTTMQVGELPVFIAGDANADRPLMHEAADEGAIAGYNAARETPTHFWRKVPLGIAFSDPDIAAVGMRFDALPTYGVVVGTGSGDKNGRARILGATDSLLRVYADATDGRLLGAAMVATGGEHLAHLLAWAIQRGETAHDLLALPFYHPVVEEMLQTALQDIAAQLPPLNPYPIGLTPVEHL
ncbi:dihydrolipoyl dehydrogenase [Thauera sp. 63]|uniref:dihydrolipoyl dehydrogenase n=1 Tax=Thauera sp. 63 TaxID=497321 RepID=UPI0002D1220F|nr:dihydrolipoyl dehydrogenase [Thauera sp. 63]ENO75295.1 pyridine nucleotide-disulfide oxidoreductase dimerization region [Thauera sp. 63]